MAPRRRQIARTTDSQADNAPTTSNSYLDRLPTELVDRICDFLPQRDTLLNLRATCRELAAKTGERYAQKYWTVVPWLLSSRGWKNFCVMAAKHKNISSYILTLTFTTPPDHGDYDSYILAKRWGSSQVLAERCSMLTNLRTLNLEHFMFKDSRKYLRKFCHKLKLPSLAHLNISNMVILDVDLAAMLSRHGDTLHHVTLVNVDVYGGWNEMAKDMAADSGERGAGDEWRTPWTRVFEAFLSVKSICYVYIAQAKHRGSEIDFLAFADVDMFGDELPKEEFWGTTIEIVAEYDEDGFTLDGYQAITIKRDANWKKGIRRLISMYEYQIWDPEGDGTPPWGFGDEDAVVDYETEAAEDEAKPKTLDQSTIKERVEIGENGDGNNATKAASDHADTPNKSTVKDPEAEDPNVDDVKAG